MPLCAVILIVMWFVFGRDKKTIPTITTRPPEGLDPLEMEYAQIVTITDRGIYAGLLQWVSMDVLEVTTRGERIGMRRISELPADAPEHARYLFQELFQKKDTVWLDNFPASVADHKDRILERVKKRFTGKNAVVQSDTMNATMAAMALLIIAIFVIEVTVGVNVILSVFLAIALFITLALLQNGALGFRSKHDRFEVVFGGVGTAVILIAHLVLLQLYTHDPRFLCVFGICFIICIPCFMFMERRVNHRLYGQILGFREFLETAEWDKLKELSKEDPAYGMDILPYAMLFNMGTRWTAQFENKTIYSCVKEMEKAGQE